MAKTDVLDMIKKSIKSGKLVFGTKETIDLLKKGGLEIVYLSAHCPDDVTADIDHLAKLTSVTVERLAVPSDELGTLCKKQYVVSVLSIRKA